ncbi:hypothetical protein BN1708_017534, partial [Verticillium longisporum]
MKTGAYLINASRGSVVDIPALVNAMRTGKIAGAALDVYPNEPAANGEYFNANLNTWGDDIRSLNNIILTPHIGGSTEEAQRAIGVEGKSRYLFDANYTPSPTPLTAAAKGYLRRREIMETRVGNAAVLIQRVWRSRRQLRSWRQYRKKVTLIQSLWRGKLARHEYKKIREEARDLKQISYKLENKVVELTQSLGSMKAQNKTLVSQVENYEGQIKAWKNRHNALETRTKELQTEANQAGIAVARLQAMEDEMKKLQQSFEESTANIKRMQEEERELRESLRTTNTELE